MKPCLFYVLLFEMLLGAGAEALRLPATGGAARKVAYHEPVMRAAADALCSARGAADLRALLESYVVVGGGGAASALAPVKGAISCQDTRAQARDSPAGMPYSPGDRENM